MKKILCLLISAVILLTCLTACGDKATDGNASSGNIETTKGETTAAEQEKVKGFEAFKSEDMNGNEVTEKIFEGNKLTVVNIWGTFCSPCVNEMPDLEKISKEYADKGVKFIGIVIDVYFENEDSYNESKLNAAKDIIKKTGVTYTNVLPSPSLNRVKLDNVISVPETIFLDKDGNVLASYIGSNSYDVWCNRIEQYI